MFYILHGEDELKQAEELARFRGELAKDDPVTAELNTTFLDGARLTLAELRHACDTMPFMANRRLVIVRGLLGRLAPGRKGRDEESSEDEAPAWKREYLAELSDYLTRLPPTTRLAFVENEALKASHPILKRAQAEECGHIIPCDLPKEGELPGWIGQRARDKGGKLSSEAIRLLAVLVGRNPRLLDLELDKLLLYAGERQVTSHDVRALVSRAREASIWELVDCVGRRQTDRALQLLHEMLEDEAVPLYLLTMLARQVRILIQVSELRDEGLTARQMAARLKLHPYVAEKGLAQSRSFTMAQLEKAHEQLVQTDWAIKTGEMEDVLALDLLVVRLTNL